MDLKSVDENTKVLVKWIKAFNSWRRKKCRFFWVYLLNCVSIALSLYSLYYTNKININQIQEIRLISKKFNSFLGEQEDRIKRRFITVLSTFDTPEPLEKKPAGKENLQEGCANRKIFNEVKEIFPKKVVEFCRKFADKIYYTESTEPTEPKTYTINRSVYDTTNR